MQKKSILLVDGEESARSVISQSLVPLGLNIQTAADGKDAVQKLENARFSLVALELRLPDVSGLDVLKVIRTRWPGIRVVIVSACGTLESAVQAMKLEAVDFVPKPVSPPKLRELMSELLEEEEVAGAVADDFDGFMARTIGSFREWDPVKSRRALRQAIGLRPNRPEPYNLFGAAMEMEGDWLGAEKFYRAALVFDPTYKPAWHNLDRVTTVGRSGAIDLGEVTQNVRP